MGWKGRETLVIVDNYSASRRETRTSDPLSLVWLDLRQAEQFTPPPGVVAVRIKP